MKRISDFGFMLTFIVVFYTIAIVLWQVSDSVFYLWNFIFIGTSLALGAGLWPILPRRKKQIARRFSQFLVGSYMFFGLGMGLIYIGFGRLTPENMQIEGFWFWLLSGSFAASVLHYLIAKIFGPILFNRGWCGWACWTAAILDLLPWRLSPGRKPKYWGYMRYVHFAMSTGLVFLLVFYFKHTLIDNLGIVFLEKTDSHALTEYASIWRIPELWWFLIGNTTYFISGVFLAFYLKDNRAFCKYLCPITPFLKVGSCLAVLKISAKENQCTGCGICERNCPMDIKITDYIRQGSRVTSSECILCQTCVGVCPQEVLRITPGFDIGLTDNLKMNRSI